MNDNRITITIPAHNRWLPYIQDCLHRYSDMAGFSEALKEMVADSISEACEELFRKAAHVGATAPVKLRLDFRDGAVVMDIAYSAQIPLNPHLTVDYEVPEAGADLDNITGDLLWMHIIKARMDRLSFLVRGSRHILRMIKYGRKAGLEKYPWVMEIKPALRKGLYLHLDDPGAEYPASVLQAPGVGALRLGRSETFIVRNMDGKISFHDLFMAHIDALGLPSPDILIGLYEQLESMKMLATPNEDIEKQTWRRLSLRIINPDFSIPRADAVVAALHANLKFIFSPAGMAILLCIGLSGLIPWWEHIHRFQEVIAALEVRLVTEPIMIMYIYILTLFQVVLHELGHGIICKHYGGQVPRMGIMFYLASFVFYCDTTSAWNFPDKSSRIIVSLGGPIMTFAVFGIGLWAAGYYAGSNSIWEYVFVIFTIFNFFELVMNFNPFIQMDAYYILMDYTDIPNLRERAFRYLERRLLGWLGFDSDDALQANKRERRIFWWYSILGALVTFIFIAFPVYRLAHMLLFESPSGGKLIFLLLIAGLLIARLIHLSFMKIKTLRCRDYKIQ